MSDLISRAEAKEALRERFKRIPTYAIWAMHIIDELPTHKTPSNTLGALDCVERQAAMKIRFSSGFDHDGILFVPYRDVEEHLKKLPSVPRKGKWIDYSDEGFVECPFCHSATNCDGNKDELHYCFSCGAELRPQFEEPEINPCRGCEDYDWKGGCKSKGGCAKSRGEVDE